MSLLLLVFVCILPGSSLILDNYKDTMASEDGGCSHGQKKCFSESFITQHTAQCHRHCKFGGSAIAMLAAGMSPRDVACDLSVYFFKRSHLKQSFREFGITSNPTHNYV